MSAQSVHMSVSFTTLYAHAASHECHSLLNHVHALQHHRKIGFGAF